MKKNHRFRLTFVPLYLTFMLLINVDFTSWIVRLTVLLPSVLLVLLTIYEMIRDRRQRRVEQK